MKTLDLIITEEGMGGGRQLFWTFSGDPELSSLRVAMADLLGEDHPLFRAPSPRQALGEALEEVRSQWGRRIFKVVTHPEGRCIQLRTLAGDDRQAQDLEVIRVGLSGDKIAVSKHGSDTLHLQAMTAGMPRYEEASLQIQAAYLRRLTRITASQLGDRFASVLKDLGGVLLRESGGLWYVPPDTSEQALAVAQAIEGTGHGVIYCPPMMKAAEAARMVMAALTADVAKAAEEITEWVAERESNPAPQQLEHGVDCKVRDIGEVVAKVDRYRTTLALNVTGLQDQLDRLRGRVQGLLKLKAATEEGRVAAAGERGLLDLDEGGAGGAEEYEAPTLDLLD